MGDAEQSHGRGETIQLPPPLRRGEASFEEVMFRRRSTRQFSSQPLQLAALGQLLFAAQGITRPPDRRAVPSAGALYPLEADVVTLRVSGLAAGVYRYLPRSHSLLARAQGDSGAALTEAALGQEMLGQAAAVLVLSAVYERTTWKYGRRGVQYVHFEVGCAAQNVHLQAAALGLGTVFIGAFHDDQVVRILRLERDEVPLCLLPVGWPV